MDTSMKDHVTPEERLDMISHIPEEIWLHVAFCFGLAIIVCLGAAILIHNILR